MWYVDESTDPSILVMTAVAIPFLRQVEGTWSLVWEDHLRNIQDWRRQLSKQHGVPVSKELKGSKLLGGRGRYLRGKHQLTPQLATNAYRWSLSSLGFLPDSSVISVVGTPRSNLYGHTRLEAVLLTLFQRLRTACNKGGALG